MNTRPPPQLLEKLHLLEIFFCFTFGWQVAEYAVDSLKQLALKFMYKEELRDFNFQRLFLCPFESVFLATQHQDIKGLILDCVQNLVQVRAKGDDAGGVDAFWGGLM